MQINQLRYFVAAARAGSISKAAEICGVAQPSLSQQIKKLEQSLNLDLFDRVGRGVVLTDAGSALLPKANEILRSVDNIESSLAAEIEGGVGRLAVGAIPTMAPYILPKAIAALRKRFPECEIVVTEDLTDNLIDAVVSNTLDLAIMSTPIDHEQIDLQVIGREELLIVSPDTGDLDHLGEITLAGLKGLPRVSLHEMHCLSQQIEGFCNRKGLGKDIACTSTQLTTVLELVRLGMGVSLVPEMAAKHQGTKGLRYAKIKRNGPMREIAIARRSGRSASMLASQFSKIIAAAY